MRRVLDPSAHIDLMDALRITARELPREELEDLCARTEVLPIDATAAHRRAVAATLGSPHARQMAFVVVERWIAVGIALAPSAFAWALRAAADMDTWHRTRQRIELVWTGPTPPGSTLRRIDQGLLEVIRRARESIVVVTFAAWETPLLQAALREALDRGVRVTFVIETREDSGGRLNGDVRDAMGADLMRRTEVYVWPLDQRPREGDRSRGSLHAKCALADDCLLLVSSANLTEHAMSLNMELGLLVDGGEVPGRVGAHLRGLVREGVLRIAKSVRPDSVT